MENKKEDGTIYHMNCLNCGSTWGAHYGKYCDSSRDSGGRMYTPFSLDEVCGRCGKKLKDHYRHMECYSEKGYDVFIRVSFTQGSIMDGELEKMFVF